MEFVPTIGLEVHTQLNTKTKLFCSDKNDPIEAEPNTHICPVCMGHPGTLPVVNKEAINKIVRAGIALECTINQWSKFDRKNYFYPDLPKGYQISQYDIPFCVDGVMRLSSGKDIRILRLHLEEDAGRLIHETRPPRRIKRETEKKDSRFKIQDSSFVDFNRAGVPLIELVTEPDFSSSDEVLEFAKALQLLWRYLRISDADMEKGQMRVEANISLAEPGAPLGVKVEVKNINSFKSVKDGIAYEIKRQGEILRRGQKIIQETRGWSQQKHKTFSQRKKEVEQDYRYFPEPDLVPVVLSDEQLRNIKHMVPELPWERTARFIKEYGLPSDDATRLVQQKKVGEYFEQVISELRRWERDVERKNVVKQHMPRLTKLTANYLLTEIPRIALLIRQDRAVLQQRITPENFAELIVITHSGLVSSSAAQEILLEMAKNGGDPSIIIEEKKLSQVSKEDEIAGIVQLVIQENEKAADDYRKGKTGAVQFLTGKAMAKSKGKANPQVVAEFLKKMLK